MNLDWLSIILALIAIVPQVLQWLASRNRTNAEFANVIMEGGTKAVAAVTKALDEYQEQNAELKKEIESIKAARIKREEEHTKEIDEIKARVQADLLDTKNLRADYAIAQKEIIEQKKQIEHHETLIVSLGEYVEAQNKAIEGSGIKVEVNGKFKKLLDSVYKLKVDKQ